MSDNPWKNINPLASKVLAIPVGHWGSREEASYNRYYAIDRMRWCIEGVIDPSGGMGWSYQLASADHAIEKLWSVDGVNEIPQEFKKAMHQAIMELQQGVKKLTEPFTVNGWEVKPNKDRWMKIRSIDLFVVAMDRIVVQKETAPAINFIERGEKCIWETMDWVFSEAERKNKEDILRYAEMGIDLNAPIEQGVRK